MFSATTFSTCFPSFAIIGSCLMCSTSKFSVRLNISKTVEAMEELRKPKTYSGSARLKMQQPEMPNNQPAGISLIEKEPRDPFGCFDLLPGTQHSHLAYVHRSANQCPRQTRLMRLWQTISLIPTSFCTDSLQLPFIHKLFQAVRNGASGDI